MTLRAIHDFELALLDPCLAMAERGLLVDEERRRQMLADLSAMREPLLAEVRAVVLPLLAAVQPLPRASLFREQWTCPCCRGGKAKAQACWGCARFVRKPTVRELQRALAAQERRNFVFADDALLKLSPCAVCDGDGKRTTLVFNPDSEQQIKVVLYDILRLPKRTKDGKLRSDEEALKDLRPYDTSGLTDRLLTIAKAGTMASILERIAPAEDGRIRSFYNPAGTETGRFSSAESFLIASTNLQNMPKREVAGEPRFDVRACIVADPGAVLVEADLSGAEAWVTAALCGDTDLLDRMRSGTDVHRWTASRIYAKPMDAVTPTERQMGKVARHALNYGMQWQTFQRNVNAQADRTGISVTAAEAKRITAAYHAMHPRLEVWWHTVADTLAASRRLTTCFGRTRTFFGRGGSEWLSDTHREAIAYEPQSTVADLLNRGMLRWWRQYDGRFGELRMQVHDSVVLCVPQAKASAAARLLRAALTEPITVNGITLTIPVDVKVGERWNQMEAV